MSLRLPLLFGLALIGLALDPTLALGQDAPAIDSGATAWMLTSTSLVLLMTPGLAMFYGGLVRTRNVLGTMMHAFAAMAIVGVLWAVCGYAMAFGPNVLGGWFGWDSNLVLLGGLENSVVGSDDSLVPEYVFAMFQGKFAIITPALIAGAFAERVKFLGFCVFVALWSLLVYNPLCHWVWAGDGFFYARGAIDFAGGTVVHISSGISALVAALYLGARKGYPGTAMHPNNLTMTLIGAGLLWVGWFGFNAGSEWAPDGLAAAAMLNTQVAAAGAALSWMIIEWVERKKPGMLGLASGAVAGLVAVTPAAGFVNPQGALIIGIVGGAGAYVGAVWLKKMLKYDDSLDAFGVHGIAGLIGALLTGALADPAINSAGEGASVITQAYGVVATIAWAAIATFVILMICKFTTGLRVSEEEEVEGLDMSLHGEALHE